MQIKKKVLAWPFRNAVFMYTREELYISRVLLRSGALRGTVRSVGEANNNIITTTFLQNGQSYLKPVLHEPSFRSVRFSRVHLPVSLHTCFSACRCLGLCDSRNDFCADLSIWDLRRYLCTTPEGLLKRVLWRILPEKMNRIWKISDWVIPKLACLRSQR